MIHFSNIKLRSSSLRVSKFSNINIFYYFKVYIQVFINGEQIAEFPLNCPWYRVYEIVIEGPPDSVSILNFILATPRSRHSPPPPYSEGSSQQYRFSGTTASQPTYPTGGASVYPGGNPPYPSKGKSLYQDAINPFGGNVGNMSYPTSGNQGNNSLPYPTSVPNIGSNAGNSSTIFSLNPTPTLSASSGPTNNPRNSPTPGPPNYPMQPGNPGGPIGSMNYPMNPMQPGNPGGPIGSSNYPMNPAAPGSKNYPMNPMGSGTSGKPPGSPNYPMNPMQPGNPGGPIGSPNYPMNPMQPGNPGGPIGSANYPNYPNPLPHPPGLGMGLNNTLIRGQNIQQYPYPQQPGIGSGIR